MKQTILPAGRSHSVPRCMHDFFANLETLPGVEEVRSPEFLRRRYSREFRTQIQYYDETTRTLRIKAHYKAFIGFFNLRINPNYRHDVANYICGYQPNNGNNGQQH